MITVITDSSIYINKKEAQALGIKIIPLNYKVENEIYSEGFRDENEDFEELLKEPEKISTAGPSLDAFFNSFEEELKSGNEVLCITISSRLSGAYSVAQKAAKQTKSKIVEVFDSHLTAGGLYLLVKKAKELVDSGLELYKIIKQLPKERDKITTIFSVGEMEPLRRSGRIGFVRMSVGTVLNIKPILRLEEGAVVSDSFARGETETIKMLNSKVPSDMKEIIINYISNKRMATNLFNVLQESHPKAKISLHNMGPVLGLHLGLNVIGVSFT